MALPIFSTADLSAAVTQFRMDFQSVWDQTPSWVDKCATMLPVSSSIVEMPWQQVLPQMRPWLGNRKVNQMVLNAQTYKPALFELTTGISRSDAEDDKLGLTLATQPQLMAREIKRHPEILITQQLEANPNTFDGAAFFSATHPVDSSKTGSPTTNSNILLSSALTADNVNKLQAQLMTLQGPDGTPTNFFCATLMVHPKNALLARQIANSAFFPTTLGSAGGNAAGPVSNEMKGFVDVVVNPYMGMQDGALGSHGADRWYLFCTTAGISPLIWFDRVAPEIEYRTAPSDWNVFDQDTYLIGARRRGVAGLGLYYMAGVGTTESSLPSIPAPDPNQ